MSSLSLWHARETVSSPPSQRNDTRVLFVSFNDTGHFKGWLPHKFTGVWRSFSASLQTITDFLLFMTSGHSWWLRRMHLWTIKQSSGHVRHCYTTIRIRQLYNHVYTLSCYILVLAVTRLRYSIDRLSTCLLFTIYHPPTRIIQQHICVWPKLESWICELWIVNLPIYYRVENINI